MHPTICCNSLLIVIFDLSYLSGLVAQWLGRWM